MTMGSSANDSLPAVTATKPSTVFIYFFPSNFTIVAFGLFFFIYRLLIFSGLKSTAGIFHTMFFCLHLFLFQGNPLNSLSWKKPTGLMVALECLKLKNSQRLVLQLFNFPQNEVPIRKKLWLHHFVLFFLHNRKNILQNIVVFLWYFNFAV